MTMNKKKLVYLLIASIVNSNLTLSMAEQTAKYNGDIYVATAGNKNGDGNSFDNQSNVDLDEVMSICNASFSIPMDYIIKFNSTGELPNIVDKTAPCYIRCFYEKSGFIDNWKLNSNKIRKYMWPATGDSIEVCQEEGKNESNACLRTYAIAKCLMIRALVDAQSSLNK